MKYENAKDIFPQELLREIQKYTQGKIIYIPICKEKQPWGELSGYKQYLNKRNVEIKRKFTDGICIEALADEYWLSVESIKKIVYSKKGDELMKESDNEKTIVLDSVSDNNLSVIDILKSVYTAMEEKHYDSLNQIVGFIVTGDPAYITSHNNARDLIMDVDRDEIIRQLLKVCLKLDS